MKCPECHHECKSLNECNNYQKFNLVVLDAKKIAQIRKSIPKAVTNFKGNSKWFNDEHGTGGRFESVKFSSHTEYKYRFMTITFDPKKFSFKELANFEKLHNYVLNALYELREYFDGNIILVREYHNSGLPHYHLNYSCHDQFLHHHIVFRMKYYFQAHLNNKHCIHDRIFNAGGQEYIKKTNSNYIRFCEFDNIDGQDFTEFLNDL